MPKVVPNQGLTFLKKAHDDFVSLSEELCFDKKCVRDRNVVAFYCSLLELTGSCILLVDRKLITGVPVLLLQDLSNEATLDETISKWREEKNKLKEKGYKALSIATKFKWAQMEKEYRSIYNSLCCQAHNNLRALIERHIEPEHGDFEVVFYKKSTPKEAAVYVWTNANLLINASQLVHEFFKSPVQGKIQSYRDELDKLACESHRRF